jgi:Mg-chelatase subunit ChlD
MTLAAAALLALAAAGLLAVRSATPPARCAAWLLCLGCAAAALLLPTTTWREQPARVAAANLRTEPRASATALLAAASVASPRAHALHGFWREPLPTPPPGALGARVAVPPTLPFAPQDLALQQLGPAERDRPLLLRLLPLAVADELPGELCIRRGGVVVQRTPCPVGPRALDIAFTPALAGEYTLDLAIAAGPTNATARGVLTVAEPRGVLVVEPSGLCAEALRTQGLAVVAADAVPDDLSPFAAVVVGAPLPANAEGALAIAARDGLGVFAVAPGLGAEGGPLRGLLPLRLLPAAAPTPGEGNGAGEPTPGPPAPEPPTDVPPPTEPPPPPPADQPPVGDTQGRGQLSEQPIEVDKRAIAMALLVDRSASMGSFLGDGNTKMSYAKTSALRTAEALTAGDRVGIVTFGNKGEGRIELPMTDAADAAKVRAGIEKLRHAQEYTYLLGGLRVAVDALRPVQAAVKHIVVVSDGEFDFNEELALRALARRARQQDRITVSVITIADGSIGPSFTRAAEGLVADGGGEFFTVARADSVPAFVSAEVTRSLSRVGRTPRSGDGAQPQPPTANPPTPPAPPPPTPPPPKPPAPEPQPKPAPLPTRIAVVAVAESPLLAPAPQPTWPALGAVAANRATADATTLLAARDAAGSAVLAYGNRGLGRVGCFAAELFGPAGDAFRAEPAFPARLAQWVTAVLPAQQLAAPQSLLFAVELSPVVPTPAEQRALAALGGAPTVDPQELALQKDPTDLAHAHTSQVPAAAGWLLLGFVALAALERWTATRALRAGRS